MIADFILFLALTMGLLTFVGLMIMAHLFVKDILIPFWRIYILGEKT